MSTRRSTQTAMNTLIISILALVAVTIAAPVELEIAVPIVSQNLDGPNPDGSYNWGYESANGIKAEEQGVIKNAGTPDEENSVQGGYSYTGDDGKLISVTYTAGTDGFVATGAHFPQAPAIPDAILKALEWIAAHPEEDNL